MDFKACSIFTEYLKNLLKKVRYNTELNIINVLMAENNLFLLEILDWFMIKFTIVIDFYGTGGDCLLNKSVTIHDIARAVQVSSATVSRVLSNSKYPVSIEMRNMIQKAAKDMEYIPNMFGKQLKTKQSRMIGVIVPTITNPFYSTFCFGN